MRAFDARIAGNYDETTASRRTRRPRILATPRYGISLFTTTHTRAPTYIHLSLELENLEAPHGVPFASQAVKPAWSWHANFAGLAFATSVWPVSSVGVAIDGWRIGVPSEFCPTATHGISRPWRNRGLAVRRAPCAVRRPGASRPGLAPALRGPAGAYRSLPGDRVAAGR